MTTARLKPSIADGHGLTPSVVDRIYNDLVTGKDPGTIPFLGVLKPVEHGEKLTAAGTSRWVRFEAVKAEPILDSHDAEQVRWQIEQAWDARHGGQTLPLDFEARSETEQARHLHTLLDEWRTEEGLTEGDLGERWRTHWGIEDGQPSPDGSFPHPDYRKAAAHHLREFALMTGVLADDNIAETADDDEAAAVSDG